MPSDPSAEARSGKAEALAKQGKTPAKGWSAERRACQALLIRQSRPWTCSTGPKTAQGKALSAINARTHGMRSAASVAHFRRIRRYLRRCRERNDLVAAHLRGLISMAELKASLAASFTLEPEPPAVRRTG